jgi:hypothetical protein
MSWGYHVSRRGATRIAIRGLCMQPILVQAVVHGMLKEFYGDTPVLANMLWSMGHCFNEIQGGAH